MKAPAVFLLVVLAFALGLGTGLNVGEHPSHESVSSQTELLPRPAQKSTAPALEEPSAIVQATHADPISSARTEIAGEFPPPQPALPARISGSIMVTVLDSIGLPLADAAVQKRREQGGGEDLVAMQGGFGRSARLLTDATGHATLTGVPWGEYRIVAEREGLAPGLSEAVLLSPEAPELSAQVTLLVGGNVVGELRDVNGAPAAAIALSIHPNRFRLGPSALVLRQASTDRTGAFAFEHLPSGPYDIYTRAKGEDLRRVPEQHILIEVREGETTRVQFKDVAGTAVLVSGQILRNGEPLPRATVFVGWADFGRQPSIHRSADADAQGRFQILLEEAGEYRFGISAASRDSSSGIATFQEMIPAVAQHEIVLAFATGSLSGRVTGASGGPASGVNVRARAGKPANPRLPSGGGSVSTNSEGRYTFMDLPAGRYRLLATRTNGNQAAFDGSGESEEVLLEPGAALQNVDIQLPAGGAVEGRVLRANGTPVLGAHVEWRRLLGEQSGSTDEQGNFKIGGLSAGSGWIRATGERGCSPWMPVETAVNTTARKDLVIAQGTIVVIEVEDANGVAAQAAVTLSLGEDATAEAVTVLDGKGRVGPLAPGSYKVQLRRDWRKETSPTVDSTVVLTGAAEQVLRLRFP